MCQRSRFSLQGELTGSLQSYGIRYTHWNSYYDEICTRDSSSAQYEVHVVVVTRHLRQNTYTKSSAFDSQCCYRFHRSVCRSSRLRSQSPWSPAPSAKPVRTTRLQLESDTTHSSVLLLSFRRNAFRKPEPVFKG